jgi:flavin reductase (DIM6/NTAB) family NADH-FMN oxidoreductase RutF
MLQNIIRRDDVHKNVLVSVRSSSEYPNTSLDKDALSIVDWHMAASINPLRYTISVLSTHGTRKMISKSGNFVVNFMGKEHGPKLAMFHSQDGSLVDLFSLIGLGKKESEKVESPSVLEAKARLECEVVQELESGDHTLFIGRVLHTENK